MKLLRVLLGLFCGLTRAKDLVQSEKLQEQIELQELKDHAKTLEGFGLANPELYRAYSSPGFVSTVKYIREQLEPVSDYYDIHIQTVNHNDSIGVAHVTANNESLSAEGVGFSPNGSVTAPAVLFADFGCYEADVPPDVSGKVAIILRGECGIDRKVIFAGEAGAVGAVLYNNQPGPASGFSFPQDTMETIKYLPTGTISQEDGIAVANILNQGGNVTISLQASSTPIFRTSDNIIIQTKGGDQDNIVFFGAHSDSVPDGPGINDNGSGTGALLAIARALANWETNNAVRFAWWTAEEFGLIGSAYYVQTLPTEEKKKIKTYLNADMIASPNYRFGILDGTKNLFNVSIPQGSEEPMLFFEDYFRQEGLNSTRVPLGVGGGSDYLFFLFDGIPVGGLFTGAGDIKTEEEVEMYGGEAGIAYDVNYHQIGDTFQNLNFDAFLVNTRALAAAAAHYGRDLSSIPPRNLTLNRRSVATPQKRRQFV